MFRKILRKVGRKARLSRQRRIIRRFHEIYYGYPLRDDLEKTSTWRDGMTSWLGIPCEKCPLDLWIYQELIFRTKPNVIVETGVNYGGTTRYLASLLDLLGGGEVFGIDVTLARVYPTVSAHQRISLYEGSSTDLSIIKQVEKRIDGRRTMVILDSDHSQEHVSRELQLYSGLVTPGCYLIVEDTNVNGHPVAPKHGPGPCEAVEQFLLGRKDFRIDRDQHKFLMTFNPNGYLRRLQEGEER